MSQEVKPLTNQASPDEIKTKKPILVRASDIELMPDSTAALFQSTPRLGSLIMRGFLAFIAAAFIWAFFAELDEVTVGDGKVIPSSQVQIIQNMEGGIIAGIPVKVGDIVNKGDIVMQLDETRFSSSLGETKAKYEALVVKAARLSAEAYGKTFQIPAGLAKANPKLVADETELYQSRQHELETTVSVLQQQASQRAQELQEKKAKLEQLQESFSLIDRELEMSKPLVLQGAVSEVEILRLERQLSDIRGEMDAARLSLPRLEQATNEARTKVVGALAKFRSDAANDLNLANAELAGTTATSVAAEDRLARTAVRSPMTGIIKQIKANTVGGVIQPGMEVMEIVPLEDTLLLETKVRPSDVAFIHPGQDAMVKLSAYDFSIYGGLEASVENISADTITEDKNGKSESYYLVQVRTKSSSLVSRGKKLPIIPGMLATVHIRTGHKTVLNYLLKPVMKAKYEAMRER
jgi:adhesin transport system membrane fusion protein